MINHRLQKVAGIGAIVSALLLAAIAGFNADQPRHPCVTFNVGFHASGICGR